MDRSLRVSGDRWGGRVACLGVAALFAVPHVSFFVSPGVPTTARVAVLLLSCATAAWPAVGLMVLAAFGPINLLCAQFLEVPGHLAFGEVLLVSTLIGWWAGAGKHNVELPRWLACAAVVLGGVALASALTQLSVARLRAPDDALWWASLRAIAVKEFYSGAIAELQVFRTVFQWLEGLALLVASAATARHGHIRPLVRMAVIGWTAAGAVNVLRIFAAALAQADATAWLLSQGALRVNVLFADVNAAGSVFAMTLLAAVGLALCRPRRVLWAGTSIVILSALWLTGSRSAVAAVLGCAAMWTGRAVRFRGVRTSHAVVAAMLGLSIVGGAVYRLWPQKRNASASTAWMIRVEMAATSWRMWKTAPVFGIGVGNFQARSGEFSSERLRYWYPSENAHNNFLQILAELGLVGLGAFVFVLCSALPSAKDAMAAPLTGGLFWGVAAYLLTMLVGHPLIVPQAAMPFWLLLGVATAARTSATARRAPSLTAAVILAGLALALPYRIAAAERAAYLEHVYKGFDRVWIRDHTDRPYLSLRDERGTLYLEGNGRLAAVPLQSASGTLTVSVSLDGRPFQELDVPEGRWTVLRFVVPPARDGRRFRALELEPRAAHPGARGLRIGRVTRQ